MSKEDGAYWLQKELEVRVSEINNVASFAFKRHMLSAVETVSLGTVVGFGCVVMLLHTRHIGTFTAVMCCLVLAISAVMHYVNYVFTAGRRAIKAAKEHVVESIAPEHESGLKWSFVEEKCTSLLFSVRLTHFSIKKTEQNTQSRSRTDSSSILHFSRLSADCLFVSPGLTAFGFVPDDVKLRS